MSAIAEQTALSETAIAEAVDRELPPLGLHAGIDDETYHRGPGISKSGLDLIARSPLHYITAKRHPKPDTAAYKVGKAFHTRVMEPDTWNDKFAVLPPNPPKKPSLRQRQAKKMNQATIDAIAFWDNWEATNGDKVTLTNTVGENGSFWSPGQYDHICRMADAIRKHPVASILLDPNSGMAEKSAYWIDQKTGKLCKCRPDYLNEAHDLAVDLKSTEDASYTEAGKSSGKWRYYVQEPWYMDGLRQCGMTPQAFVFVFCEKTPPYGIGVYMLSRDAIQIGREVYRRNLDTYAKCHSADEWPSYPAEIRDLEIPKWGLMERIG